MNRRRSIAGILIVLAAGSALAGCTPGAPGSTPTPTSSIAVTTAPGTATGYVGARADVTVKDCAARDGALSVTGSVKNPAKTAQKYRIYVSAVTDKATVGLTEVDVASVAPGATRAWETTVTVSAPDSRCILRVERSKAH